MTRAEAWLMFVDGGLREKFKEADRSHETIHGSIPEAYVVPKWLYEVMELMQDDKPLWYGRKIDPWDKSEIRGQ